MRYLLLLLLACFCCPLGAQTLDIGHLVLTGYNADADPNNPNINDEFSFVLLAAVESGQIITFTDRGWLAGGGFRVGEGSIALTFAANHACGDEFHVFEESNVWKVNSLNGGAAPTIIETDDFSLSSSGDQILVYNGSTPPTAGDQTAFITALHFAGAWHAEASGSVESSQPSIFASNPGNDFVVNPHLDNGKYNCFINSGDAATIRSHVYNAANWGFENSSSNRFDLSAACAFFCQGACTAATITSLSSNNSNNTFCIGEEVTVTINGTLNDAALWTVNDGSCGGEQILSTTTNSFSFTATKTTTLHISGFGGCVTTLDCTPITITVVGTLANAGPDQRLAAGTTSTSLQANAAQGGNGTWTVVEEGDGNGVIAEPNNAGSTFSGTTGQQYTLAWTIENTDCSINSTDQVSITFLNPTSLQLGDIAFTGYNADEDDFSFALLTAVDAGTSLTFTENGWLAAGGLTNSESSFTFEFSRAYDCGSNFVVFDLPVLKVLDPAGEIAGNIIDGTFLSLSTTGDQIFAYQGTPPTALDQSHFIAAIQMNGDWDADATNSNESAQPSVFTNGQNAIVITPEAQNAKYNCSVTASPAAELAGILNNSDNWDSGNNPFVLDGDGNCELACEDCISPVLTAVDLPTINPCPGDPITLSITGQLNGAAEWVVFADVCGGEVLATSTSNMIEIIPPLSGSFFVAPRGGCVANLSCTNAMITLGGILADAGPDQKISAATSTTLAANASLGQGEWSFADAGDGQGNISDLSDPTATFSGTAGQSYTLRWSLAATNDCGTSSDEVVISYLNPTTLTLGDLVFISYSADEDDFAFVILKDIDAGTTLNFTDRGWLPTGGFRAGEGDIRITFCRPYACGTEFDVFDLIQQVKDGSGQVAGTISGIPLDLSTSGDQIFAYQNIEPNAVDQSSFVAAIQMNGEWDTGEIGTVESNLPSVFTNGENAVAISPESDNAYYSCAVSGPMEPAETRAAVNNPNNWIKEDAVSAALPLNCILRCCDDFVISQISGADAGPYCIGDLVTLTLDGQLKGAADWVWYQGDCGAGTPLGMGTSITYKINSNAAIFVRGEGGCADISTTCTSISLPLEETSPTALCQDITIQLGETFTADDINNGSTDNCGDISLSVTPATLDCTTLGPNTVVLNVEDGIGRIDSCMAIVTVEGEDEDCDGVADECDLCPSGDDKVDNNFNGIPDCTEFSTIDEVIEAWRCGPLLDSVFVCSIVNGDPTSAQTFCVPPVAVNDILTAGGYVGPCGNTPCGGITPTLNASSQLALLVYPNPAREVLFIQLSAGQFDKLEIVLYNNLGQQVKTSFHDQVGESPIALSTQGLRSGIYFIHFKSVDGRQAQQTLVISKE